MKNLNPGDFTTLANLVSLLRLILCPVLWYLSYRQMATFYILTILFVEFTDLLDGFIARNFGEITELGARLDSLGDFFVYISYIIGAYLLWPDTVKQHSMVAAIIITSIILPILVGLIKFRELTSYHTWATKIAVGSTVIAYILLFMEIDSRIIYAAAFLCIVAAIEEIGISLLLEKNQTDIKSVFFVKKKSNTEK